VLQIWIRDPLHPGSQIKSANADPDPVYYVKSDENPDPDPDPGQTSSKNSSVVEP
jgi:hypothetical protein